MEAAELADSGWPRGLKCDGVLCAAVACWRIDFDFALVGWDGAKRARFEEVKSEPTSFVARNRCP